MGASFSSKLVGGTTHLVAKNVLSVKYEVSPSVQTYGIGRFDVLIVVVVFGDVTYCGMINMNECCRGTMSNTNPTWTVLELNLSLHDWRLATAA